MNLFIDFFYKKTVIKYTANIYQEDSQTYPSRKQDTSELFFDLLVKTGAETPQKQENATL